MTLPLVEMRGVGRHFGGVRAVEGVDLSLAAGEILGLVGHNGAGKSTLMRGLSGADPFDEGEVRIEGAPARIRTPRDARRLGIETVYQDLALADNLDAVANLFLGREPTHHGLLDEAGMEAQARKVLARVNPDFDALRVPVRSLSGGQRQAVAIARALRFRARLLILDEPTASLGPAETAMVHTVVRRLRDEGLAIVVVSHDLHDLLELADRVAVLRTGRLVAAAPREGTSRDQIVRWMLGEEG